MAAVKCCATSACHVQGPAPRDHAGQTVSLANAISHLNTVSAGVSVEPADYSWGVPSPLQQQALYSQFLQLAFMCSLPQLQYLSSLQVGRQALFPGFMPPFAGFMPPVALPCPAPSPSPPPCSPAAPQVSGQGKSNGARPEVSCLKAGKNSLPSKKSSLGSLKARAYKNASGMNSFLPAPPAGVVKMETGKELEDIYNLLGDELFENLQDADVLSEGSNGSSSTSVGRAISKNNSNCCLSGSVNNDGGFFDGHDFSTAFDMDIDGLGAAAPCTATPFTTASTFRAPLPPQAPVKVGSGDLNNLVAAAPQPSRSTRAGRSAAREAAAAARDTGAAAAIGGTAKMTLKVAKGGVQKSGGSKPSKSVAAAAVAAAAAMPSVAPSVAPLAQQTLTQADDPQLTEADISRFLGEDDNGIPEGWELDLDFEDPFSCSISAF